MAEGEGEEADDDFVGCGADGDGLEGFGGIESDALDEGVVDVAELDGFVFALSCGEEPIVEIDGVDEECRGLRAVLIFDGDATVFDSGLHRVCDANQEESEFGTGVREGDGDFVREIVPEGGASDVGTGSGSEEGESAGSREGSSALTKGRVIDTDRSGTCEVVVIPGVPSVASDGEGDPFGAG